MHDSPAGRLHKARRLSNFSGITITNAALVLALGKLAYDVRSTELHIVSDTAAEWSYSREEARRPSELLETQRKMVPPIDSQRIFNIPTDASGSSIDVKISEKAGVQAENLSLSTWGSAYILASRLHKIDYCSHRMRSDRSGEHDQFFMLELGAGTGLVGLTASIIWKAKVILTDLPPILPELAENIRLNKSSLMVASTSAFCGSLDWKNPTHIHTYSDDPKDEHSIISSEDPALKPSVILAADTIYTSDHPELLSNTISTWLAPGPHSRAILCYPLRMAYLDEIRRFWELMAQGGLRCIEEGREEAKEEWGEVPGTEFEWCIWAWTQQEQPT